jgi:putative spermidine/putrescine transport system ATP-binding protein
MVSLGSESDANRLTGTVTDVSFLGSIVRIRVGIEDGPNATSNVILDEFNEPTLNLPTLGDTVTVSFPIEGPLVLDAKAPVEEVEALIAEA